VYARLAPGSALQGAPKNEVMRMTSWVGTFYGSSIGKKAVMAITGIILFGFVVGHMIGNMSMYSGRESINNYATLLRTSMPLLWTVRMVLLGSVLLHIWAAWQLVQANKAARAVEYRHRKDRRTTYAARTMQWSGPILAAFIVYHILHLTLGYGPGGTASHDPHDVYANVVRGFSVWYISALYIISMVALGFHMRHGVWSLFQSLGWNHPKYNDLRRYFAGGITWIVVIGNISFPIAVLTGIVH
jgi:succinate dehydrogenase / fumarate reductase cytochrome b subunit